MGLADRLSNRQATSLLERRDERDFVVRGRLRKGASLAQAQAGLSTLASALARTYAGTNRDRTFTACTELGYRLKQAPATGIMAALLSALVFGLAPAWQAVRTDVAPSLRSGEQGEGRRGHMLGRNLLVAGQVACSPVLLVASVAFLDAFRRMLVLDPGVRTEGVMMMEFNPTMVGFTPERTREFYRRLIDDVRALPGVRTVSLARGIPFRPNFTEQAVVPQGYLFPSGLRSATVSSNVVDEQYFEVAGTPIERGRAFTSLDTAGSRRVGIVNSEFARRAAQIDPALQLR